MSGMRLSDPAPCNPDQLIEAVLDAAAGGRITQGSALRLIFAICKARAKGHVWWKRASWARYWNVHPTTITRDYGSWVTLGFVKIRANPFKASAKILIFPWSRVWNDAVWADPTKVASMLGDVAQSFKKEGRAGASQKGCGRATYPPRHPLNESSKHKNTQQPSRESSSASTDAAPGKLRKTSDEVLADRAVADGVIADNDSVGGDSEIRALLEEHSVGVKAGQIETLIEKGRSNGLTVREVLAFVGDKLESKRAQRDPVYSAGLLIRAIDNKADLRQWALRNSGRAHSSKPGNQVPSGYSPDQITSHFKRCVHALRAAGYDDIANTLEVIDVNAMQGEPERLEQELTAIEGAMIARARAAASENQLADAQHAADRELKPYRGKMSTDQLTMIEAQFLERKLLEAAGLPRLSLFYL